MGRREFIAGFGGMLVLPLLLAQALAQQPTESHRIAVIMPTTPIRQITPADHSLFRAFLERMQELGYTEGQNLIIERYSAEGHPDRLPDIARTVVESRPDLILGITEPVANALKGATTTIPIVTLVADPVAQGLVSSLVRPGGNVTGVSAYAGLEMLGKYFEILKEIDPKISRIGLLTPRTTWERSYGSALSAIAGRSSVTVLGPPLEPPIDKHEYDRAVAAMVKNGAQALVADVTGPNFVYQKTIAAVADAYHLPALSAFAGHVKLGGLVSYTTDFEDQWRHMAEQVDRILKGSKPGDLPFQQPTRFKLIINMKAANRLGLTIPPSLLARADEVIE